MIVMQAEGETDGNSRDDLKSFREKLLGRYIDLRKRHGRAVSMSFDELWYDFLLQHMVSETPMEKVFEEVCAKLERNGLLYLHDRNHR